MKPKPLIIPELAVITLALLVRLIQLNGSFWLDEAAQALESQRPLSQQLQLANDFQPPLYHLVVHLLIQFGTTEAWLRLASLIPGLITVWLTMKIGQHLFNRDVGLTAGVLLATSQFHLFYSQELRPYALAACLALASFWYWLQLMRSHPRFSWGFFVSSLAGLYSMYLFPVFLLTLLLLTAILYRARFKLLTNHFVLLGFSFLPWLPSFIGQLQVGIELAAAKPLWASIVSPPILKMLPLVYLKFIFGRIPYDPTWPTLTVTALVILTLLITSVRIIRSLSGKLTLALAFIPPFLGFLISLFVPVLDPKRVLFSLPFLCIALAAGLRKRWLDAAMVILMLSINMSALRLYATDPDSQREPWRQAVAHLEADAPADTTVIFAFNAPFAPWVWYQHRNLPTRSITDPQTFPSLTSSYVASFAYLHELYDPDNLITQKLIHQGYFATGFYQYPGIGKINVYAR